MRLLGRIIVEKRAAVIPIAVALVANLAAYIFLVYPLQARAASGQARMLEATRAERLADRDLAAARAVESGKQTAETQLRQFYQHVLPANLADARKAAYLRLAQLQAECNVRYVRQVAGEEADRETGLTKLSISLVLDGSYQDVRRFIHAVETAPEFLIIDSVALATGKEANTPLVVTLGVATFYRTAP